MLQVHIPFPVIKAISTLLQAGFEAYIVGGAVRDTLLGKETVIDWDITTNATPEEMLKLIPNSFYDNAFGTVMVDPKHLVTETDLHLVDDHLDVLDITTFRSETGYTNRRHPDQVMWGNSLEEDVRRRDFTINALAFQVEKDAIEASLNQPQAYITTAIKLIDYFSGQSDLQHKKIRTVGDPRERFSEDALRMMRAIRFAAQLGFEVESQTLTAISDQAELIKTISGERIRDELFKILGSPHPTEGIELLDQVGLLQFILPELLEGKDLPQGGRHIYDVYRHALESLRECPSRDPLVRLATLLHDIGKPRTAVKQGPRGVTFYGHEVVGAHMSKEIANRLRLSNKQKQKLYTLIRWHMFTYTPEMTDSAIRRFIRNVGVDNINDMMMLRVGDRKGGGSRATSWRLRELQQRIGENLYTPLSVKDLVIDGTDVMKHLSLKPGPIIGKILNTLFEAVMEGELENERAVLLSKAKEIVETEDDATANA